MRSMEMEEQCSARITWDVLVSSLHFGCRGCILDEGWAALDSARHRGDQRESDRGSEHRLESRSIAEGRQKDARRKSREPVLCCVERWGQTWSSFGEKGFLVHN